MAVDNHVRNGGERNNVREVSAPETSPIELELSKLAESGGGSCLETISSVAGNILEWYDFAVFGFFSEVISGVFFPPNQKGHKALLESFAVFGGAFMMRPVGGIIMGYVGDTLGRKKALEISIFLMAFPTFAMGCLPSYAAVGWISTLLLIIVRLLQGLSVGGQLMSSLVFTLERHPHARWGWYGSFVLGAANFGTLIGGIMAAILKNSLSESQLASWGWRIPFLSGIIVGLSGMYLKFYVKEDPLSHLNAKHSDDYEVNKPVNPLKEAFGRENRRSLLSAIMVPMLWAGGFYMTFVWMAVFMDKMVDPPVPKSFVVNSLSLFISVCLFFPVAGWLSDVWGRRCVMNMGGIGLMLFTPLAVLIVNKGNAVGAFAAQCFIGICLSFWGAPMMAWLVESFPPESRLTAVAIGYNLAQAIAGGITPVLATFVVYNVGPNRVGLMITALAVIGLTGLNCVSQNRRYDTENYLELDIESDVQSVIQDSPEDENRASWEARNTDTENIVIFGREIS